MENSNRTLSDSSSRIEDTANAKRLKSNGNVNGDDDDQKHPAIFSVSTIAPFPLLDDHLLLLIFSFVGKHQYRLMGSVNNRFHESYLSFDPSKKTNIIATTIEQTKLVLADIEANRCVCVLPRCGFDERSEMKNKSDERCELWKVAARYATMDEIKYLHEAFSSRSNIEYEDWKHKMCYKAAMYGHLELLQWAIDNGVALTTDHTVRQFALANGHMKLFHWLEDVGFVFDPDFFDHDYSTEYMAARNGQLEALKYLHANGGDVVEFWSRDGSNGCVNWAARYGHLEVVKFLHSLGCAWDDDTVGTAVSNGEIEVLEYLLSNDCATHHDSCVIAASRGNLVALKLLCSYNCKWGQTVPATAAACGHVDIIEWACNNGCPSSELSCQYAAGYGQLETLKWLHTNNFPWDTTTTEYALTDEIYEWAVDNGCPVGIGNPRKQLKTRVAQYFMSE